MLISTRSRFDTFSNFLVMDILQLCNQVEGKGNSEFESALVDLMYCNCALSHLLETDYVLILSPMLFDLI